MNVEKFAEAMNEIDDKYIMEALETNKSTILRLNWWKFHKIAACCLAILLITVFSFGTALAVSADFRQAIISFFSPGYTENELHEIDEGHRSGSFSMEDTLFSFLEKFNNENMVEDVTIKKEHGFEYIVLPNDENSIDVIVECTNPHDKLLVVMTNNGYAETTGLWQVIGYQILDSKTANDMIANKK